MLLVFRIGPDAAQLVHIVVDEILLRLLRRLDLLKPCTLLRKVHIKVLLRHGRVQLFHYELFLLSLARLTHEHLLEEVALLRREHFLEAWIEEDEFAREAFDFVTSAVEFETVIWLVPVQTDEHVLEVHVAEAEANIMQIHDHLDELVQQHEPVLHLDFHQELWAHLQHR